MDDNEPLTADTAQNTGTLPSEWQKYCHEYGEKDAKVIAAFRDERTHTNINTFTKITETALENIKSVIADELQGLRVRAYLFSDDFISLSKTFRKSEEERTFLWSVDSSGQGRLPEPRLGSPHREDEGLRGRHDL